MTQRHAVIFDFDGLLVNSEPLWLEAETAIYGELGLQMTEELSAQTLGMRPDEAVLHHFQREPWSGPSPAEITERLVERVVHLAHGRIQPMPGVARALEMIRERTGRIAVASSSPRRVIDGFLRELGLADVFPVVCSAEDEEYGKPHPAVFLRAASRLAVDPQLCVVFEDAVGGVIAARAAWMGAVVVPHPAQADDPQLAIAHLCLESLRELEPAHLDQLGL